MLYNVWKRDYYECNVFLFAHNGCIISCALNTPGYMQESTVVDGGMRYEKLDNLYIAHRTRCVEDAAFRKC